MLGVHDHLIAGSQHKRPAVKIIDFSSRFKSNADKFHHNATFSDRKRQPEPWGRMAADSRMSRASRLSRALAWAWIRR